MSIIREMIYEEISMERAMQEARYVKEFDDAHFINDWIAITCRHLGLATSDGGEEDRGRFRKQMIRVAALAIAAVEAFDRKYPKEKVIDQSIRGSGV